MRYEDGDEGTGGGNAMKRRGTRTGTDELDVKYDERRRWVWVD